MALFLAIRLVKESTIVSEALKIWLSAYGSAAGDLVLQELCSAGLWISGGASAKNIKGIKNFILSNTRALVIPKIIYSISENHSFCFNQIDIIMSICSLRSLA